VAERADGANGFVVTIVVQKLDIGVQRGSRDEEVGGCTPRCVSAMARFCCSPRTRCQREPGIGTLANEAGSSATSSARRALGASRTSSTTTKSHTRTRPLVASRLNQLARSGLRRSRTQVQTAVSTSVGADSGGGVSTVICGAGCAPLSDLFGAAIESRRTSKSDSARRQAASRSAASTVVLAPVVPSASAALRSASRSMLIRAEPGNDRCRQSEGDHGSRRVTVPTRSMERSKDTTSQTPVASAWATR
jgi:hypothetical protein